VGKAEALYKRQEREQEALPPRPDYSAAGVLLNACELAQALLEQLKVGGRLGATLDLAAVPVAFRSAVDPAHRDLVTAFAESPGRFICEVRAADAAAFEQTLAGVPWAWVGAVTSEPDVAIGSAGRLDRIAVARLDAAWRRMSHQEHSGGHG
jgi:phosphoribosylformylglycinamidine (FGAM) synthase-like enzyme